MGQKTIDEINNFTTFKFDKNTNRVVNMRFQEETNIDEFHERLQRALVVERVSKHSKYTR